MTEPVIYAVPVPPPAGPPVRRPVNRWNVASLLTLIGGHVLVAMGGLVFAIINFDTDSDLSSERAASFLGLIVWPFAALSSGFGSIFAIAALVLAIVGLRKSKSTFGVVMIVVCSIFSLGVFSLIPWLLYSVAFAGSGGF